jgi:hypothetical protein
MLNWSGKTGHRVKICPTLATGYSKSAHNPFVVSLNQTVKKSGQLRFSSAVDIQLFQTRRVGQGRSTAACAPQSIRPDPAKSATVIPAPEIAAPVALWPRQNCSKAIRTGGERLAHMPPCRGFEEDGNGKGAEQEAEKSSVLFIKNYRYFSQCYRFLGTLCGGGGGMGT